MVSRLTGLSPHVIRVWEKRYGAVVPARTGTNRRLYSDDDVERLRWLARATDAGHKIGIIARLDLADLRRLVATSGVGFEDRVHGRGSVSEGPEKQGAGLGVGASASAGGRSSEAPGKAGLESSPPEGSAEALDARLVREALEATRSFRSDALQKALEQGAVRMGPNGVLHRMVYPLAWEIGELWQRGELTAAHEHFASSAIREFLLRSTRPYAWEDGAPRVVVTTPAGQLHELGAVMSAAAAANLGWRPVYLGPSLPPAEIAGAVIQNRARAVLLSIVYPADDPWLPRDLVQLRKLLPAAVAIVVGGRSARAYSVVLKEIGAVTPAGLEELCDLLEAMREPGAPGGGAGMGTEGTEGSDGKT
ncbi:MAG: MerR family transcriptional regulator [Limisphaerales bacterium]